MIWGEGSRKMKFYFGFWMVLGICLLYPGYGFTEYIPEDTDQRVKWSQDKEKTWIQLEAPIPEGEKNKKWPWLPAEKFPFKAPYTGDEMAWFSNHETQIFSRAYDAAALSIRLNRRGHLIQRAYCQRNKETHNWNELLDLDLLKPGEPFFFQFQIYLDPKEKRGAGFITKKYQETPEFTKYPDIWVYVPALRRNRRVGISDRADCVSGCDITWDDMVTRVPWQSTHTIIGTDVLYEVTGVKQAVDSPDKYTWNPYREDDGMECYVVKEVHSDPNYYLSKRIVWYERTTKLMLRDEQYDRKGDLLRVMEIAYLIDMAGADYFSPEHHAKGIMMRQVHHAWTVDIDHRTYSPFHSDDIWYGRPLFTIGMYNPGQLLKEEEWRARTKIPYLKSARDLLPRPPLYRDKFPKYRKIVLPEELEKKLEKHK